MQLATISKSLLNYRRKSVDLNEFFMALLYGFHKTENTLLVFVRGTNMLNVPGSLFELLAHSTDTHAYPTIHATRGLFTVLQNRLWEAHSTT
jgi:hypothetical protein